MLCVKTFTCMLPFQHKTIQEFTVSTLVRRYILAYVIYKCELKVTSKRFNLFS